MPAIGWANDDLPFVLFNGSTQTNPSAHGFDALVKTCIECSFISGESHRAYFTDDYWGGAARSSFLWEVASVHSPGSGGAFGTMSGQWITFKDISGAGNDLFRLKNNSINPSSGTEDCQFQYWDGAAWQNIGLAQPVPSQKTIHTFLISISDTVGVAQWYMNGALMASKTGDTKFTSSTTVDCVAHWGWGNSGLGDYEMFFAEHKLADIDFQSYGLRCTDRFGTGIGTYAQQATGLYTDVNETVKNTATVATIDTVGNTMSINVDDLDASLATSAIIGVMVGALVRRGDTGPQKAKLGYVLAAGGLQLSAAKTIGGVGYGPLGFPVFTNPTTTQPFTYAQVNSMEVAVQGAT